MNQVLTQLATRNFPDSHLVPDKGATSWKASQDSNFKAPSSVETCKSKPQPKPKSIEKSRARVIVVARIYDQSHVSENPLGCGHTKTTFIVCG